MANFQLFTADAEDPFIASYPTMDLLATNDFGLQSLPFSSDGAQAKASAKPYPQGTQALRRQQCVHTD